MKGRIVQGAKLYFQAEGSDAIRHIATWEAYVAICKDLGIGTGYNEKDRTFLEVLPPVGRPITEWPEQEPQTTIGPMRLMFNVPELTDKREVAALGITDILSYGTEWMDDQGRDFLNSCIDTEGEPFIRVVYSLKSSIHDPIRAGGTWNRDSVDRLISRFDSHSAVSGWYILDEHDAANPVIPYATQREIVHFVRDRSDKPITFALRGGTVGWHLADLDLPDYLITDTYPYNGTGRIWDMEPLDAIRLVGEQEREYLADFLGLKVIFLVQCCDEPAVSRDPPIHNSKVPLSHVKDIFDAIAPYGVFSKGVGFWGYDGGYFGPQTSPEMYQEVKSLINNIGGE